MPAMPASPTGPREKGEPRSRRFLTDEAEANRKALTQLDGWRRKAEPQLDKLDEWRAKAEPQIDQLVEDVAGHTKRLDGLDKKLDRVLAAVGPNE